MNHRLSGVQAAAVAAAIVEMYTPIPVGHWEIVNAQQERQITYWLGKIDEILSAPEVSPGADLPTVEEIYQLNQRLAELAEADD